MIGRIFPLGFEANIFLRNFLVMRDSFTNQCLAQIKLAAEDLDTRVYILPRELDEEVARLYLARLDVRLTQLSGIENSFVDRLVKLVVMLVMVFAAFLTVLQLLGYLEKFKNLLGIGA